MKLCAEYMFGICHAFRGAVFLVGMVTERDTDGPITFRDSVVGQSNGDVVLKGFPPGRSIMRHHLSA